MAKRRKKSHHEEGEMGEAWLLPYSDLMTLLLAVFIVLFAVSKMDTDKSKAMAEAFRGILVTHGSNAIEEGGDPIGQPNTLPNATEVPTEAPTEDENNVISQNDLSNLEELQSDLNNYFKQQGLDDVVATHIDERGLVISLNNAILFDSGSASIKSGNIHFLVKIGDIVNKLNNYIRIEGHTDNIPITSASGSYPSNWELSSARAAQVVRLFVEKSNIDPEKMVAVGYGEFKPIAKNDTEQGRAKNRRVDIIILNTKYNSLEDQITDVKKIKD